MLINESLTQQERNELWAKLIGVVENWLYGKDYTPKDFTNEDREGDPDEAIIYGKDFDELADGFADALGIRRDNGNEVYDGYDFRKWAHRELNLYATSRPVSKTFYACVDKAMDMVIDSEYPQAAISLLNSVVSHRVLTPIDDKVDDWMLYQEKSDGTKEYRCKRRTSLFKYVHPDGKVEYDDLDRVVKRLDQGEAANTIWYDPLTRGIVNTLFPITLPYMPEQRQYVVHCEEFLYSAEGDPKTEYDTVGIYYITTPAGEKVNVTRFFTDVGQETREIPVNVYYNMKTEVSKRNAAKEEGNRNE